MDSRVSVNKRCIDCGRNVYQPLVVCSSCGGELASVPAGTKVDRNNFHRRRVFCLKCPNFGIHTNTKGEAKEGCGLMESPCSVEQGWLNSRDGWCPADRNTVRPPTTWRADIGVMIVSSLSRLPHHISRQTAALDSWKACGFTIAIVNTTEEVYDLIEQYPQVTHWIEENETSVEFETRGDLRRTQYIKRLAMVAKQFNTPVMVTNSDIEIYGDPALMTRRMDDNAFVVGIKHNYHGTDYALAEREKYGLDAFIFTPEMAEELPSMPFAMGRPVWDYWLPEHFRSSGYEMRFVGDPLLFHQWHLLHWNRDDWAKAAKWLNDAYGCDCRYDVADYRNSFPFPVT